jgi:transaldolase
MIKIPATPAGIPAIRQALAEGININITLIFSIENYRQVVEAYLAALEERLAAGKDIRQIASVASFFVSRVDVLVDQLLEDKIHATRDPAEQQRLRALQGKAAIANARLVYQEFKRLFGTPRFEKLKNSGARVQRPLWASTSTKNPAYRDVLYAEELIGPDTVDTMPLQRLSTSASMVGCNSLLRTTSRRRKRALQPSRTLGSTTSRSPGSCRRKACDGSPTPSTSCWQALKASGRPSGKGRWHRGDPSNVRGARASNSRREVHSHHTAA